MIGYKQCIFHASNDSPLPVGIRDVWDSGRPGAHHASYHVLHDAFRVMYAMNISRSVCMWEDTCTAYFIRPPVPVGLRGFGKGSMRLASRQQTECMQ